MQISMGLAILIGALAIAVFTDLRTRKVPNLLVLAGILCAATFHAFAVAGNGILEDRKSVV